MIRIIFQTIAIMLLIIYLSAAYILSANEVKQIVCNDFKVEIADSGKFCLISSSDIKRTLNSRDLNPLGKSFSVINTDIIETNIKELRQVESVDCYKTPAGSVVLSVKQRIPIIRIINARGGHYYVDRNGFEMPISTNSSAYVPIATGDITTEFACNDLYKLAKFLDNNPYWNSQVQQIVVNGSESISIIPRVGNHTIILGKADELDIKFDNLQLLYSKGFKRVGWNKYKTIDLRFKNQIICTK
ncbi:MAG: cell division protein FtsQ/DivIB [Bacteroidales bacterium]